MNAYFRYFRYCQIWFYKSRFMWDLGYKRNNENYYKFSSSRKENIDPRNFIALLIDIILTFL